MLRQRLVLAADGNRDSVPPAKVEAYQLHGNVFAFMGKPRSSNSTPTGLDNSMTKPLPHNSGRGRKATHGHSARGAMSKTYNSWRGMIERCKPHKQYGKLGISVCERWKSFSNFLEDMGERPEGCEIDRKDCLKAYSAENCQWTAKRTNRQHRRSTILTPELRNEIVLLRDSGFTLRQIAEKFNVSVSCVADFLRGASWRNPEQEVVLPPSWTIA